MDKYKIEEYITPWGKKEYNVWKLVLDGYFWHLEATYKTLEEAENHIKGRCSDGEKISLYWPRQNN